MSAAGIAVLGAVVAIIAAVLGAGLGAFIAHRLGRDDELAKEIRLRRQVWEDSVGLRLASIESHLASIEAVMAAFDLVPKRQRP